MKPFLIRHLEGESLGRFPVWMMRQAGRYLPSYREIRKDHTFWEMVTNPELAAAVTLLPFEVMSLDVAIFFSDILTLPYGMKIPIDMVEKIGPVVREPLREEKDFSLFTDFNPEKHTSFVGTALRSVREKLSPEVALAGFAGAPWTVACYLVEGKGKQGFQKIVEWSERDPKSLTAALEKLSGATSSYLNYQIHSGANLIQLFDTWLPSMPMDYFKNYYAPMMESLWKQIGKNRKVPRIYFAKGAKAFLPQMIDWEIEVVGVDSSLSLKEAEVLTQARFSLQGNLSSEILFEPENEVRNRTRRLVSEARQLKKPAILNLGHGILPKTPVENAKAFVTEARSLWI